jgi:hypothetical protein
MLVLAQLTASVRLWTVFLLLSYLLAGASLALPSEPRCGWCARTGVDYTITPGTSCPLSHHGHDCYNAEKKTAAKIVLCPGGYLRHNGQGGEIPSLAKFLSSPDTSLPGWLPATPMLRKQSLTLLSPYLPQPDHPPSLLS